MQNRSAEINEIAAALSKAQSTMDVAGLNKKNPFFKSKYADFMSVVEASRPALTVNGLAVTQQVVQEEEGSPFLETTLLHSSGQWIMSRVKITPAKTDVQSLSSYITYMKRMCYSSLIGVVTGDEDDDGEYAVAPTRINQNKMSGPREDVITPEQLEELEFELQGETRICAMVLDGLKIGTLAEMPKSKFLASIQRIREIKDLNKNR